MLKLSNSLKFSTPLLALLLVGALGSTVAGCKSTGDESVKEDSTESESTLDNDDDEEEKEADDKTDEENDDDDDDTDDQKTEAATDSTEVRAEGQRMKNPKVSEEAMQELVAGNTQFALDLYTKVSGESENIFYSPFSVSEALAMVSAGARGETADQMLKTLHLSQDKDALHPAFNALDSHLMNLGEKPRKPESEPFELTVANSIWGQNGEEFNTVFLETLAANYGAGLNTLDFISAPEASRETINEWVEEKTQERIEDLLPKGSVNSRTRLVLANAIYFKASWMAAFQEESTKPGKFTLRDGSTVETDLMHQSANFDYAQMDGFKAIALPYDGGDVSMLVMLPKNLDKFEKSLSAKTLNDTVAALKKKHVTLTLPEFEFTVPLTLTKTLQDMGMVDAFGGSADFSGMTDADDLRISEVIHKAYVSVDEAGTEAAAATAVTMRATSMPIDPVQFTADKPFVFVIRDNKTGSLLFVGRLANPDKETD